MGKRVWIARQWHFPKVVIAFFPIELGVTVATLALYGIADPDLYRTKLWQDGFQNGFNSNPEQILLDYANHLNPKAPLVWSQFITTFNLVISILSTFMLLVKSVMFVMHTWVPLLSLIVHAALTALYAFSTYAQLSSDKSDPQHLQDGPPWYISRGCAVAHDKGLIGYCKQAQASFAVAVVMTAIFFVHVILASLSVIPTRQERAIRGEFDEDTDSEADYDPEAHGAASLYDHEKPAFFPPQTPRTPLTSQTPLSPKPYPSTTARSKEQEDYEMAVLQKRRAEAASAPPQPEHDSNNKRQETFATNLTNLYLSHSAQHSPAKAITTSERTPDFPRDSPRPPTKEMNAIPFFDPPPTAPLPTPRTMAFNRLSGKGNAGSSRAGGSGLRKFVLRGGGGGKEKKKEKKEEMERERARKREEQVQRYLELQRAGPPPPPPPGERGMHLALEARVGGGGRGGGGGLPFRERYGD